jgi:hypothetical protein
VLTTRVETILDNIIIDHRNRKRQERWGKKEEKIVRAKRGKIITIHSIKTKEEVIILFVLVH